jgi:CHAD domain-containing protein
MDNHELNPDKVLKKEFVRYARKRTRKLKRTFKDIAETSHSEAVHDFRKTTRDLQTVVDVCAIDSGSRRAKKLRRRLQKCRHALSGWRDGDVMLREIKRAQRKAKPRETRQCWIRVAERAEKGRRRAADKFFQVSESLRIRATISQIQSLVKKRAQPDRVTANLRLLVQKCWDRWNGTVDRYLTDGGAENLHAVRIKAKSLRYAIEFSQQFYPDRKLGQASRWLKDIQDQVGAWHDELTLGQQVLRSFSKSHPTHDSRELQLIREIKEEELEMAESAHTFLSSIREMEEYQRLKRDLAVLVYAMTDASDPESQTVDGPIY